MLPAPVTNPYDSGSASSSRSALPWPVIIAAALMLYALAAGWGLLGGLISPERAYLLMALPCLVPMIWCFAGILQNRNGPSTAYEQEAGLWVSGAGWLLLAFGLLVKHIAILRAQPDAYAAQASSPIVPLCIGLGILGLILGALISWLAWKDDEPA